MLCKNKKKKQRMRTLIKSANTISNTVVISRRQVCLEQVFILLFNKLTLISALHLLCILLLLLLQYRDKKELANCCAGQDDCYSSGLHISE